MDVGRTEGIQGPVRIESNSIQPARPVESAPLAPADRLDISEVDRLSAEAVLLPSVRLERVAELKRQIEAGLYQTDQKLIEAFERFRTEET